MKRVAGPLVAIAVLLSGCGGQTAAPGIPTFTAVVTGATMAPTTPSTVQATAAPTLQPTALPTSTSAPTQAPTVTMGATATAVPTVKPSPVATSPASTAAPSPAAPQGAAAASAKATTAGGAASPAPAAAQTTPAAAGPATTVPAGATTASTSPQPAGSTPPAGGATPAAPPAPPQPAGKPAPATTVLPGSILPAKRIVAYYGNQLAPVMGVLGEPPPEQMLARLQKQADAYAAADPKRPVQPALELVAIVAQAGAGDDGMYRRRMDPELINQVIDWAQSKNYIVFLDIQNGRSSMETEVQALLPYLKKPNVHLALDPEFSMGKNEVPSTVFGSIDAAQINNATKVLADLVTSEKLPPKVMIIHRFIEEMVTNYKQIKIDPRVQIVMDMDGFGSPENKTTKYQVYMRDQRVQFAGFKLFYQQDAPVMTPQQVLALDPIPDLIIYQ